QQVLDRLPKAGATDLRKNRSILNNLILTTTGAAKALPLVLPEMQRIGFIAESVRIPTSTGSLIVLVLNLQDDLASPVKRKLINSIYRDFAAKSPYLKYSEEQNVSTDIIAAPFAAAVIEGTETHTRTAAIRVNLANLGLSCTGGQSLIEVPVTQAVVYAWYDNELGSYTNMLADRTVSIAEQLV
ncbi:MAG: glyceraldehyde-3-phosphate dehydrogenase, partial [Thermodesulfobacteriota bacterium]